MIANIWSTIYSPCRVTFGAPFIYHAEVLSEHHLFIMQSYIRSTIYTSCRDTSGAPFIHHADLHSEHHLYIMQSYIPSTIFTSCRITLGAPYPRIHRLLSSLSPLLPAARSYSPLIAAERKYHLATARPYNETNTVGRE